MTIREQLELRETTYLSPYAALSKDSRGRKKEEAECDIRPVFQRDRDRILHCKSFRRLNQKIQVFLLPKGNHYRTRLTHTLEVSQNARTIAKALRLNEDLVEAIALGHDLGHTPFGHAGGRALDAISPSGFKHNVQSLSDKIAYINHDIDDAIRGGILQEKDIPSAYTKALGTTTRIRLDTMIHNVIINSMDMITNLYQYYIAHLDALPDQFLQMSEEKGMKEEQIVCDYIAGMTDTYAVKKFEEYFVPESWNI